jgi:thiosulfate/3-mercaptopyruvate sulfurtransferase
VSAPAARQLISTDALAERLGDPALRVFDCTVLFDVGPDGLKIFSGRDAWTAGHVPGAGFLDLLTGLSDPDSPYHFMLPAADRFAAVMSEHGVGPETEVVLYDGAGSIWAARVWWMLRAHGFDDAAVLDGGWTKWTLEGRPVETGEAQYRPAQFEARPRAGVFVGKDEVLAAVGDAGACLVNGLSEEMHRGTGPTVPGGRPGHIPGSVNVPAAHVVDPETQAFLGEAELRALLAEAGVSATGRIVTYCGGGIAASGVAFALGLLGYDDVAVYDASLEEWATDPSLPLEVG